MIRRKGVVFAVGIVVLATVVFVLSPTTLAQGPYCVRAGATGANNGSDWNNAYTMLPATLQRGATYYIADGSYGGYIFDDATSGSTVITIKKATVAEHGSPTGWQNSYGDGQASFNGQFNFRTDYYVINGVSRNEDNWRDVGAYGFYIHDLYARNYDTDVAGDHITVQYCDLGYPYSETYYSGMNTAVYLAGFNSTITHWTVSRCAMHNATHTIVQLAGTSDCVFEYNWIGPGWGKEAIRGQGVSTRNVIRFNRFWRASQIDPEDNTSGTTAEVAIWGVDEAGILDNNEIYGNWFYNPVSSGRNGVIVVGGDGAGWYGLGAANTKVYNNTFVGLNEVSVFGEIDLNGSNTEAKNNLFYNCAGNSVNASATANNVRATVNPFVNYSGLDLRITAGSQAQNAGTALGAAYNKDGYGVTRGADGAWDVGAFEYGEVGPDTNPPVISGAAAGSITTNSARISFTTSELAKSGVEYGSTTSYGSSATNNTLSGTHSIQLNGLAPNTTYHYRVHATDAAGNRTTSGNFTFQTSQIPAPDANAPVISGVNVLGITANLATIAFSTSEPARSGVEEGTTTSYGGSSTNTVLTTTHSILLNGLLPLTLYHYRIHATDAAGNHAQTGDLTFQTVALDLVAPTISLTAPAGGSVVSNTVSLTATASDNVAVSGVVFMVDGAQVGSEDTTSPYSIAWDTFAVANGTHTVAARARDAVGNQTTSGTASITVANQVSNGTFNIGDRVLVSSDPSLRVRSAAALSGTVLGEQSVGALGTVVAGPVDADGFAWWQINYDNDPDGWSIEGVSGSAWLVRDSSSSIPQPPAGLRVVGN